MNIIEKELFQTKALKISGTETPFWYTSGTFGPFYINTHFLFGGEEYASKTLDFINENKKDKYDFPGIMTRYALEFYNSNDKYKKIVDSLIQLITDNVNIDDVDYISGGERRDWFFSYICAYLLQKPHLTIYKNLIVMKSVNGTSDRLFDGEGGNILHIADLVTEGSSYFKYWIPALKKINMNLKWTLAVVDRQQGGTGAIINAGIHVITGAVFSKALFNNALSEGEITKSQYEMVKKYMKSPDSFMREFVSTHPKFLRESIDKDEKTRERAIAFIKKSDIKR